MLTLIVILRETDILSVINIPLAIAMIPLRIGIRPSFIQSLYREVPFTMSIFVS